MVMELLKAPHNLAKQVKKVNTGLEKREFPLL